MDGVQLQAQNILPQSPLICIFITIQQLNNLKWVLKNIPMCYVILHSWVKKNCCKKVVNYFKRQIPCNKIKIDSLSRGKVRKKKGGDMRNGPR